MTFIKSPLPISKWKKHWDLSLDYPVVLDIIRANLGRLRAMNVEKELVYNAIILTQLSNESRISEAQEALVTWATTASSRELRIRTRKRYDQEERLVVIPSSIVDEDRVIIAKFAKCFTRMIMKNEKEVLDCSAVRQYARRAYGINTHSLRYAGITDLGVSKEVSPLVIAKITKHKNLNQLLTYLEEKEGVKKLREQVSQA